MPLSEEDKQAIIDRLNRLEAARIDVILATEAALVTWLEATVYWIYERIRDFVSDVWQTIKSIFS